MSRLSTSLPVQLDKDHQDLGLGDNEHAWARKENQGPILVYQHFGWAYYFICCFE